MQFDSVKALLPAPGSSSRIQLEQRVQPIFDELAVRLSEGAPLLFEDLLRVAHTSGFATKMLSRYVSQLTESDVLAWHQPLTYDAISKQINLCLRDVTNVTSLYKGLRIYRNQFQLRIIFRDANGLSTLKQTMSELSWMAEQMMHQSLAFLNAELCSELSASYAPDEAVNMYIIALGKLGAYELNLSSDVDLIFGFSEGETSAHNTNKMSHQEFFIRLGQRFIKLLSEVTEDGFVFRVDMRLRPFGQSGALVWSTSAMVDYYQRHGREWERYALIKARFIAGDRTEANALLSQIKPFVFRRYIDFSVFDALREMKALIKREVSRKSAQDNIKIGQGGIREVEFIGQVFQLLRGGRIRELRNPNLLQVLSSCQELGILPEVKASSLRLAYIFFRQLEHRLQAVADRQTQTLPGDEESRAKIASAMAHSNWDTLKALLDHYREQVHECFNELIRESKAVSEVRSEDDRWVALWQVSLDQDQAQNLALLSQLTDEDAGVFLKLIADFRQVCSKKQLQTIAHDRLNLLMPILLERIYEGEVKYRMADVWARLGPESFVIAPELSVQWAGACETFRRIQGLLEAILRRSAYLVLFIENPQALKELVKLFGASPWIADQLAAHPNLLDELLDASTLYTPPDKFLLNDELRQQLLRVSDSDLESQMDALRLFKQVHVLRTAAAEIGSRLALMNVSDYLTHLAEVLLEAALTIAWQQVTERYGYPVDEAGEALDNGLIIVGYGKLGGIELSYSSDLDLVFIYNAPSNGLTTGDKPVENLVFYTRLVQRMVHIISTHTLGGRLYEVDLRLRPSGNKGLIVSSIAAFEAYQRDAAWNWEHQALVRARVVVGGDTPLAQQFRQVRDKILTLPKNKPELQEKVSEMRDKMQAHLGSKKADNCFHLKYDSGGMVDIEFIAQYLVLLHASAQPDLLRCTDNIRIFECLGAHAIMTEFESRGLIKSYLKYRAAIHRLTLQNKPMKLSVGAMADSRTLVRHVWKLILNRN